MQWQWAYPPDVPSAPSARRAAVGALREAGVPMDSLSVVHACLAELVANAVLHACTEFTVTVRLDEQQVRVEVFDADTRPPALLGIDADSTSGRGLHVVRALASDWGWYPAEQEGVTGKVVWAEFALSRPLERSAAG